MNFQEAQKLHKAIKEAEAESRWKKGHSGIQLQVYQPLRDGKDTT